MYAKPKYHSTKVERNQSVQGEPMHIKIERMMTNGDKSDETVELIFTERNEGVLNGYNIRTDRFDIALDALSVAEKSTQARRNGLQNNPLKIVQDEPTHGEVTDNESQ